MAVVLSTSRHPTTSILVQSHQQQHLLAPSSNSFTYSDSSASSTSGSCLDLHRPSSAPSTRRIHFAPLPDPRKDGIESDDTACTDEPQPEPKTTTSPPQQPKVEDGFVTLSPSISPDSSLSSAQSTPTIRVTSSSSKPKSKLLRPLAFLRRTQSPSSSPRSHSASLPGSRNTSTASLPQSSNSVPNSPMAYTSKLPRISAEDVLTLGTISFFRARSGSSSSTHPKRPSSPRLSEGKPLQRWASTGSGAGMKLDNGKRDWGDKDTSALEGEGDVKGIGGSGPKRRRASSSALTPGAGGGRHASSSKMLSVGASASAGGSPVTKISPLVPPKPHVRMLNGRIYGAKRHAAQIKANPFATARDEPEFVEWGYGGMGSVHASAGVGSDVWRGLQRGETGGALLSSGSGASLGKVVEGKETVGSWKEVGFGVGSTVISGGGRGGLARSAASPRSSRPVMSDTPECGMGSVGAGSGGAADDEDGSGMGWVKKRRAEREAKAREREAREKEANEREGKDREGRKSGDSTDAEAGASMSASTSSSMSTSTNATTPFASTSTSVTDLSSSPTSLRSPVVEVTCGGEVESPSSPEPAPQPTSLHIPQTAFSPVTSQDPTPLPTPTPKDEHHVLTAIRISPHRSSSSKTHIRTPSLSQSLSQVGMGADEQTDVPLSPIDTEESSEESKSEGSAEEEEPSKQNDGEEEQDEDDDEDEDDVEETRKTSLGAGVEKLDSTIISSVFIPPYRAPHAYLAVYRISFIIHRFSCHLSSVSVYSLRCFIVILERPLVASTARRHLIVAFGASSPQKLSPLVDRHRSVDAPHLFSIDDFLRRHPHPHRSLTAVHISTSLLISLLIAPLAFIILIPRFPIPYPVHHQNSPLLATHTGAFPGCVGIVYNPRLSLS
ncbi:hypothetical protein HYDPIDRAFT_29565 [Hydnomerulius pinastri MD-312]|uniref:Uncharacterized protein n=1 Tax=Hydnomerulius pinastri MD-312 TaxID=994086 RepID=A0A0C9WEG5_9AGAM|nr:hypothetical protein HYDPIDRAFT_29565 [Hydnomerulius pinastri MD-312]